MNPVQCLVTHCKMLHGKKKIDINYMVQNTLSKEESRHLVTEKYIIL